jgi:CubicO group peptidase (beta-lactamase class C family)
MKHSVLFTFFSVLVSLQPLFAQSKAAAIDTLLSHLNQKNLFNGAIVAGEKDKLIISKGYGYANFAAASPFTVNTPTDGGAIAKTLTAAAVLLLADQRKLSLLDSVQHYIPSYPYADTKIWNLLTHSTGGLPDYNYYFGKTPVTETLTNQGIIDILAKNKPALLYAPDANFSYDNAGFDIAAAIIEKVSGSSYQNFLYNQFFGPLKMQQAFVRPPLLNQWAGERVKAYSYENDVLELADIGDREGFYGGSNVWFSASDLYRWGQSFYHEPVLGEYLLPVISSWVSIRSKLSMIRLGAWYQGRNMHAHYYWGSVAGFYSFVYWDSRQQFTIAVVSNTNIPQWVRPQLTAALIDIMEGSKPQTMAETPAERVDEKQLQAITGAYDVDNLGRIDIYLKDNIPYLRGLSGMEYRIFAVDNKTFYVPGLDPWITFQKKINNQFETLQWRTSHTSLTGRRVAE